MIAKSWSKEKVSIFLIFYLISFTGLAQPVAFAQQDSIHSQKTKAGWQQTPLFKTIAAPSALVAGGLLTFKDNPVFDRYDVWEERQEYIPCFHTDADDYLQYAPIVTVLGLKIAGVKTKHSYINMAIRLATAEVISQAIVFPLKKYTHVARPDHSDFRSFPSGHTTQAFVSATFMHKELGYLSPWYSIGAYTTATAVGVLRMMNNKHWLSDVLVGAGVGILSTNVAYLIFPDRRTKKQASTGVLVLPEYDDGSIGLYVLLTLH